MAKSENSKKGSRPLVIAFSVKDKDGNVVPRGDVKVDIVCATRNKTIAMQALLDNRDLDVIEIETAD